jgi:ClpP class serine protease
LRAYEPTHDVERYADQRRTPATTLLTFARVAACWRRGVAVVPVVRLAGVIGFSTPLRPGLTLSGLARTLDKAFAQKGAKAVALVINSPGGSAVQSHLIFQRIRQMAAEKHLPVIAFVEDVAAHAIM